MQRDATHRKLVVRWAILQHCTLCAAQQLQRGMHTRSLAAMHGRRTHCAFVCSPQRHRHRPAAAANCASTQSRQHWLVRAVVATS